MEPSGYAALLEVLHWGWTLRIYNLTQLPVAFLSAVDWLCDPVSCLGPAGMPGLPHHYGLDLLSQAI